MQVTYPFKTLCGLWILIVSCSYSISVFCSPMNVPAPTIWIQKKECRLAAVISELASGKSDFGIQANMATAATQRMLGLWVRHHLQDVPKRAKHKNIIKLSLDDNPTVFRNYSCKPTFFLLYSDCWCRYIHGTAVQSPQFYILFYTWHEFQFMRVWMWLILVGKTMNMLNV